MDFTRRDALIGAGAILISVSSAPVLAQGAVKGIIDQFAEGKTPQQGKLDLDVPFTADNPNAVPVGVRVDSPMTAQSYCREVVLIAESNPRPLICRFAFAPGLSVPQLSTRIRLAETQHVTLLAKMNDGSVFIARKEVTVTSGGCGGI